MFVDSSEPGILLVDSTLKPLAMNEEAIRILSFAAPLEKVKRLEVFLTDAIRSRLVDYRSGERREFKKALTFGKRRYVCHSFKLDHAPNGAIPVTLVLLERCSSWSTALLDISSEFKLTEREREVVELLVPGFTSKEIAARLNISPNTVKSFLRMVMMKMGVSTRSGIVGKAAVRVQTWSIFSNEKHVNMQI